MLNAHATIESTRKGAMCVMRNTREPPTHAAHTDTLGNVEQRHRVVDTRGLVILLWLTLAIRPQIIWLWLRRVLVFVSFYAVTMFQTSTSFGPGIFATTSTNQRRLQYIRRLNNNLHALTYKKGLGTRWRGKRHQWTHYIMSPPLATHNPQTTVGANGCDNVRTCFDYMWVFVSLTRAVVRRHAAYDLGSRRSQQHCRQNLNRKFRCRTKTHRQTLAENLCCARSFVGPHTTAFELTPHLCLTRWAPNSPRCVRY